MQLPWDRHKCGTVIPPGAGGVPAICLPPFNDVPGHLLTSGHVRDKQSEQLCCGCTAIIGKCERRLSAKSDEMMKRREVGKEESGRDEETKR